MDDIITNTFNHNDNPYRVTQFRGGALEVYYIEKGLETFEGYTHEVTIDLAEKAWDAYFNAPGQRWLFAA